jgi:hypothetical protein
LYYRRTTALREVASWSLSPADGIISQTPNGGDVNTHPQTRRLHYQCRRFPVTRPQNHDKRCAHCHGSHLQLHRLFQCHCRLGSLGCLPQCPRRPVALHRHHFPHSYRSCPTHSLTRRANSRIPRKAVLLDDMRSAYSHIRLWRCTFELTAS